MCQGGVIPRGAPPTQRKGGEMEKGAVGSGDWEKGGVGYKMNKQIKEKKSRQTRSMTDF